MFVPFEKSTVKMTIAEMASELVGFLDGSVDGFLDGSLDGFLDGSLDGFLDGSLDASLNGFLDGSLDGFLDGFLDGSLDGFLDVDCFLLALDFLTLVGSLSLPAMGDNVGGGGAGGVFFLFGTLSLSSSTKFLL